MDLGAHIYCMPCLYARAARSEALRNSRAKNGDASLSQRNKSSSKKDAMDRDVFEPHTYPLQSPM
eukprot:1158365-Pelagomonas_calceolata.AAC.3